MRLPLALLLTPALCLAQPPDPAQPRITFDALHHDFGKIAGDTKVTHRFKVTNRGKGFLNITRLNPSCGCTSTVVGKWSLAPGESTDIEVTFNPVGFRGLSRKSLQVISDDPSNPTQTLTFEAEVIREIMPSTESIFFQDVLRTAPRKVSVKLESGNGKPVQILDAKAPDAPWLSASSRQEGLDAWVDILLDGRKVPPSKLVGADPVIVRTGNPRVPSLTLTVQWEMRPSIINEPARVAWVEGAGRELRFPVTLRHADNKPFRVLSGKTSNPVLKLDLGDKGAAPTHKIQVIMSAAAKAGSYVEKVLLTTDDPDQPELEIRVSASLR